MDCARLGLLLTFLGLVSACTRDPKVETDQVSLGLKSPLYGVELPLLETWQIEEQPLFLKGSANFIARARRGPEATLVMVAEPIEQSTKEQFNQTLRELEGLGERASIDVVRSGIMLRDHMGTEVADIQLRYRIGDGDRALRQEHRVLLIPRPTDPPSIVSVTAVFPSESTQTIEPELERMLFGLVLTEPKPETTISP